MTDPLAEAIRSVVRTEIQPAVRALVEEALAPYREFLDRGAAFLATTPPPRPNHPPPAAHPPPSTTVRPAVAAKALGRRSRTSASVTGSCAVRDCKHPAKSKGFCANHYMKFHRLEQLGRLPPGWKPFAAPGSLENVDLRAMRGSK